MAEEEVLKMPEEELAKLSEDEQEGVRKLRKYLKLKEEEEEKLQHQYMEATKDIPPQVLDVLQDSLIFEVLTIFSSLLYINPVCMCVCRCLWCARLMRTAQTFDRPVDELSRMAQQRLSHVEEYFLLLMDRHRRTLSALGRLSPTEEDVSSCTPL
jgi:hypothetical protein